MKNTLERHATKYKGVTWRWALKPGAKDEYEENFYIEYKIKGQRFEEKVGVRGKKFEIGNQLRVVNERNANYLRLKILNGEILPKRIRKESEQKAWQQEQNKMILDRLWEMYVESKGDYSSYADDRSRYDLYLRKGFGDKEPREISAWNIEKLKSQLLKARKPQTARNVLELFRRICNFGKKKNLCEPLTFIVEMPKVNNEVTENLDPNELQNLLRAIAEHGNVEVGRMMLVALYTGLRRGEIWKLTWDDIDFDRGFIRLRNPKGGKDATIPLSDGARKVFLEQPRTTSPYVFPGRNGGQRTENGEAPGQIREAAGLPKKFRPMQGLRHSFASLILETGKIDLYHIQKLLTHKSAAMTQRYAHLRDEALRRGSDLASEIIESAAASGDRE